MQKTFTSPQKTLRIRPINVQEKLFRDYLRGIYENKINSTKQLVKHLNIYRITSIICVWYCQMLQHHGL